jgi:HEAT repeat protein
MLLDSDPDLQKVALRTLTIYGPDMSSLPEADAKGALRNIIRAVERGDSDVKRTAMRTLEAIGTGAAPDAIPAISRALKDDKTETRKQAATLLGRFGPLAKDSLPALKTAMQDDDVEVRRAADQAILSITRPKQ